jgi:uncharacterized protein (TIGR03089 family)
MPLDVTAMLRKRISADGGTPLLTFYDDATGERIELSAVTLDNWVAKTANLLVDGLGWGPGDTASVALPLHWLTPVVILGALAAGLTLDDTDDEPTAVAFASEDLLSTGLRPEADDIMGVSLRPMAMPMKLQDPTVTDFLTEVRGYGDHFNGTGTPLPDADPVSGRIMLTGPALERELLLAVLAGTGSLVLCRNPDPDKLAARALSERVTDQR